MDQKDCVSIATCNIQSNRLIIQVRECLLRWYYGEFILAQYNGNVLLHCERKIQIVAYDATEQMRISMIVMQLLVGIEV